MAIVRVYLIPAALPTSSSAVINAMSIGEANESKAWYRILSCFLIVTPSHQVRRRSSSPAEPQPRLLPRRRAHLPSRHRLANKRHTRMHRRNLGSLASQRRQHVAGECSAGMKNRHAAPILRSRQLHGDAGDRIVGHGDPNQVRMVEPTFAELHHFGIYLPSECCSCHAGRGYPSAQPETQPPIPPVAG